MRTTIISAVVCLMSLMAVAESTGPCGEDETPLVPDGRLQTGNIPNGTTFFFLFETRAGHSYSVELRAPNGVFNQFTGSLSVFTPTDSNGGCVTSTLVMRDTRTVDPRLSSNGERLSFTATDTANSGRHRILVNNNSGVAQNYTLSVTDTTLYNPRWSTFGTFITQWAFRNTTNAAIDCTLTATPNLGTGSTTPVSITFTVPAGGELFRIIAAAGADINIGANRGGFAELSHDGPPGAIVADAYFINSAATVIVPSSFEPRNSQR
jgi:hypothetical protein